MIKILLRKGFRSLIDQIPDSSVNILGLTVALASVMMLIIWISLETSFDNFHKERERIYRVNMLFKTPKREINSGSINGSLS